MVEFLVQLGIGLLECLFWVGWEFGFDRWRPSRQIDLPLNRLYKARCPRCGYRTRPPPSGGGAAVVGMYTAHR